MEWAVIIRLRITIKQVVRCYDVSLLLDRMNENPGCRDVLTAECCISPFVLLAVNSLSLCCSSKTMFYLDAITRKERKRISYYSWTKKKLSVDIYLTWLLLFCTVTKIFNLSFRRFVKFRALQKCGGCNLKLKISRKLRIQIVQHKQNQQVSLI